MPKYSVLTEATFSSNQTPCVNACLALGLEGCVSMAICRQRIEAYVVPTPVEWVFIAICFLLFFIGILGNLLVCYVVWRSYHMQTVVNMFIFNLAIADFLVILFCLPPSVLADVTETWYMGDVMCRIIPFIQVSKNYNIADEHLIMMCQPPGYRLPYSPSPSISVSSPLQLPPPTCHLPPRYRLTSQALTVHVTSLSLSLFSLYS